MAKQVEDIVVRLVGEGFEALDKIKGSFRELGKVTNLAEKDILSARDSLSDFAKAAGNTEAVNKGLIDAFKGLRSQVDVNSKSYRDFSNDIARLETELRGSTAAIDRQRLALLNSADAGKQNVDSLQRQVSALRQLQRETRPNSSAFLQLGKDIDTVTIKLGKLKSEAQAFNLALGQQAGATPEVLNRQIATLQKGLQSVRFDAEQFVETLRKIQLLQITQTGRTGRAGVIADFEAFRSREYTGGFADPSRLAAMPNTTAALNQELAELSLKLNNVERGGAAYVDTSIRIADIQKRLRTELLGTTEAFRQLDIAQTGAERRSGKLADIQEYYRTQGPTAPGVGGFRDPVTGAMIAAGSRVQTGIRPGTQYDQPIGPQPVNPAFAAFESSMKQSQDRITSIYDDAYVHRTQLQADYNQISIDKLLTGLDMEGQVRNAAFGRELADFDKQLEARDRRRRRRPSTGQLVQAGGAAISGGIFGGPEGFLGGVGGAVLGTALPGIGTVGGAFAGAAAGAQVAGIRQAGAAAASYAAEIRRLQLALQGIVTSFDDYKAALTAVESTSSTFNIPIREATQQFTKLSAAVLGSGGSIKDAENTFKGLTASVLATGGSVDDVNGALVAAAQVFSKGKVTAEELRGQIGERLAGAFALFAESSGRSAKGLDAALKSGEVTIADFVKFTEFSLAKYGRTAQIIAASPEQAGARLDRALKALQQNIGDSLGPAGAAFQDFAARSVRGLDRIINKLIKLKAIQPGAGYYQQQVLEGSLSIPQLEDRLLRAGQQETALRQGAASAGLGFIADLLPDISAATKEARILEEALIKLRVIEKETNKERKERKAEEAATDREKLGASLLQAIEQREEALLNLRTQREEQLAQIREQAVEQARQIETQLADKRLAIERQIQDITQQRSDSAEDSERRIRAARGEDTGVIDAEQKIVDIFREERDSRIQSERTLADDKKQQEETIAEFQRGVARSINEANRAHTKSMGEIQKQYATSVAKIIDEGTGKAGKRLEKAAQIAAIYIQRSTLNNQILAGTGMLIPERRQGSYDFSTVGRAGAVPASGMQNVPTFKDVKIPLDAILKLDETLESLRKGLSTRRAPGIGDQFTALLGAEGGYEDVAMTRGQAALIIKKLEVAAVQKNITPDAFTNALYDIGEFAHSPDASRRTIRNLMATPGAGLAVRSPALLRNLATRQLSQDQANIKDSGVNPASLKKQIEPLLAIVSQLQKDNLLRKNVTVDETREKIQKPMYAALLDWVKANINNAQIQDILKRSLLGANAETYGVKGLLPLAAGFTPASFGVGLTPAALKADQEAKARERYEATPAGRAAKAAEEEYARQQREFRKQLDKKFGRQSAADVPEGFDTAKIATDFGQIASASFIGGLLAQNPAARRIPESQILRDSQGRPLNGSQPTAYPIPVIPSAAPTAQLRNTQAQEEEQQRQATTAQKVREAFEGINAEAAQFTNGLNDQLQLLQDQRKYLDMGFSDALSRDLANLDKGLADREVQIRATTDQLILQVQAAGGDPTIANEAYAATVARSKETYDLQVKITKELEKQTEALRLRQDDRIGLGMQEGVQSYLESIGTMRDATKELTVNGIKGVENAIFDLVTTGKTNFREFAADILKQTARMIIQQLVLRNVMLIVKSAFGFAGGGAFGGGGASLGFGGASDPLGAGGAFWNAKGNAFASNNIVPYAMGGTFTNSIVTKPTLFKFANGGTTRTGLMGEAGPEAIMPLSRGPNGKLGVASVGGGGTTNVTVNVDASGSKTQGDSGKSEQLGRAVSQAVQDELLRQRRPGGILA